MCDPVTAITALSAGASMGGQLMNSNAQEANQRRAIEAKNQATSDTLAKENALQQQSQAVFGKTLQPFQTQTPQQQVQPSQAANTSFLNSNTPSAQALSGGATTMNAPKVVQDNAASSIASRLSKMSDSNAALGNLTGYDSNNSAIARNFRGANDQLATIGDFANQDAKVGAALTDAAVTNSQQPISPFGDLLTGAGQIGAFGAGKGWFTDPLAAVKITPQQVRF